MQNVTSDAGVSSTTEGRTSRRTLSAEDRTFLLEGIVCDLQWSALSIGIITFVLNASLRGNGHIRPWRHLLLDDGPVMLLCMRFGQEAEIDAKTAAKIEQLYANTARAKADLTGLARSSTSPMRPAPSTTVEAWRGLCLVCGDAMQSLGGLVAEKLVSNYSRNAQILTAFLREAAGGSIARVNEDGELTLPVLAQRRVEARHTLRRRCKLHFNGMSVDAVVEDISRKGAGISCTHEIPDDQPIRIELEGGRMLEGRVLWRKGSRCGLQLSEELAVDELIVNG